jgi:hypothetical protein
MPCRPAGFSPIKENFGLIEIKPRELFLDRDEKCGR